MLGGRVEARGDGVSATKFSVKFSDRESCANFTSDRVVVQLRYLEYQGIWKIQLKGNFGKIYYIFRIGRIFSA